VTRVDRLFYTRHFLLLLGFGAVLNAVTRLGFLSNLYAAFALYGVLHALAVALALRRPQTASRRLSFIVIGGALSVMTLQIGLVGMRLSGTLPGNIGLYVTLGSSALIGALTYGILIRLYGIQALTPLCLALIGLACILGTYAAFFILSHTHLGRWLLVVFWWSAFSGGQWYCDRRCSTGTPSPSRCA